MLEINFKKTLFLNHLEHFSIDLHEFGYLQ